MYDPIIIDRNKWAPEVIENPEILLRQAQIQGKESFELCKTALDTAYKTGYDIFVLQHLSTGDVDFKGKGTVILMQDKFAYRCNAGRAFGTTYYLCLKIVGTSNRGMLPIYEDYFSKEQFVIEYYPGSPAAFEMHLVGEPG